MTQALFNQHADDYDNHAQIQRQIASALIKQLPININPDNILELGAGTAFISQKLSKEYFNAEITICDPAPNMIKVAKRKFTNNSKVNFICDKLPNSGQFDLIISSMAIQWVDDWSKWMSNVTKLLKPGGYLCVATPTSGTLDFLPKAFKSADLPYAGLSYRSESDLKNSASSFDIKRIFTQSFIEDFDSPLSFFRKLHKIGANVSHYPLSPIQFKRLLKECEKYKREGILAAIYEVTFLQARIS